MKFELTQKEIKRKNKFLKKHPVDYHGAVGGGYSIKFTPTGIGTLVRVIVKSGNKKYSKDITDFESW